MAFIEYDVTVDPDELMQAALDALATKFAGWVANEAHLEVAVIEEVTRIIAVLHEVARDVPAEVFRKFGTDLVGLAPIDGASAGALFTFTAVDNAGYTIPEGTVFAFRTEVGEYWTFETTADAEIAAGAVVANNVPGVAQEVGTFANGIDIGTDFEMVDALAYVIGVESSTETSGGVDAETGDEYLDRLADELTLFSPRPILARDFGILARRTEGVHRALAIDGYNPADQTNNNERMVALAAVDEDGDPVAQAVKDALDADMEARREINFVVNVIDPTYTDIAIVFEAVATADAVPAEVEADAEAAVAAYLDPANWAGGDASPPRWDDKDTVRFLEIAEVINRVPGIDYITLLTVNGGGANVALAGVAPLPSRVELNGSTVAGTVNAP